MVAALNFLEGYDKDGDKMLGHIVTGDETWVLYVTPKTKLQPLEWHHPRLPSKPKKFKQIIWRPPWRVILCVFMPRGETRNAETYFETLKKLWMASNSSPLDQSSGVVLLHDTTRAHTARHTQELLPMLKWEVKFSSIHNPNLTLLSNFHLFPKLKKFLSGIHLESCNEVNTTVL